MKATVTAPAAGMIDVGGDLTVNRPGYGTMQLIAETLGPYPAELVIATKGGLVRPGHRALGRRQACANRAVSSRPSRESRWPRTRG
jgi:hypothetical protein